MRQFGREFAEFQNAFTRHKRRSHPHVRPRITPKKNKITNIESKKLITKHLRKSITSTLAPLRVMISRQNNVRFVETTNHLSRYGNLAVRPKLSNIPRKNHKINIFLLIDIIDRRLKVRNVSSSFRHVNISQIGKLNKTVSTNRHLSVQKANSRLRLRREQTFRRPNHCRRLIFRRQIG